ncbi:hypothetical protein [Verrucomicrobium spinosum]|uniref:hypothetical protein n=1 Tax=Verrucomicrobium spinosum TaxID=2736 RepID=UPI00017463F1|nr:hypothetical protein [Verrucomicrobium spinosum]
MNVTEALQYTLALAEAGFNALPADYPERQQHHLALRITRRRFYRMHARLVKRRRRDASRPKCLR